MCGFCKANLFLDRILYQFDSVTDQLRAPLLYKDAVKLHLACGGFKFFLAKLEQIAPSKSFADMESALMSQFMSGFLDGYIISALEEQVPSAADLGNVQGFRRGVIKTKVWVGYVWTNDVDRP